MRVLSPVTTSDHCAISCDLNFILPQHNSFERFVWYYNKTDFNEYRSVLNNHDWEHCFSHDNIDDICSAWTNDFLNVSKQIVPNRLATIRPGDKPYYTNDHRRAKRKLNRAHNRAKETNAADDWSNYRDLRNIYISELRKSEATYEHNLCNALQNSSDISPKKWWNIAKSFLGIHPNNNFPPMEGNDENIICDNQEKANTFNRFFLSNTKLDDKNRALPLFVDKSGGNELNNIQTTPDEVHDILKTLKTNKATGPDGVSAKLLHEAAPAIAKPLSRLINLSLKEGRVPQTWKLANVVPIHKKNERSKFENYRPISLLSCIGKVTEKVIFKHVFNYFRDNELLSKFQSGFTPGDGTVNQLVQLYHMFSEALDKKKDVRAVFCDISKAFDRVWHSGLLLKLKQLGIKGDLLNWFDNYLKNRQQRVTIKGESSNWGHIDAGVPQGSVLGPLLFLVYINDITEGISSNIRLFADDTSLYITVDDHERASELINLDLERLRTWATKWLVTFNATKTKSMVISNKRNLVIPDIQLNNSILENVTQHTHLGVTLNYNLTWNCHIDNIFQKASKRLDILSRLTHKLDRRTLDQMYKSFIRPVMEYACVVWDGCTVTDSDRLEALQLRAGRIVCGAIRHTSHAIIYNELGWEKLSKRRERFKLILYHKMVHNIAPEYLQNLLPQSIATRNHYNVRNAAGLSQTLVRTRLSLFDNSFLPSTTRLWNMLSKDIRTISDPLVFKKALSQPMHRHNADLFVFGERKFNIIHARIRMNCSLLKAQLHDMHIIDDPSCNCGAYREDAVHFFFDCPLYSNIRIELHEAIIVYAPFNLKTLLYGDEHVTHDTNITLFRAVQMFIKRSKRFG